MRAARLAARPTEMPALQAAAAVGQIAADAALGARVRARTSVAIGQVLVTHDDLGDRRRFLSARLTLRALLDHARACRSSTRTTRSRPRRSSSATTISSPRWCATWSRADALVILTDVEGVRDASGVRMPIVRDIDREAAPVAGGSTSGVGSGGMASKVGSARIVTRTGVPAVVAPGREPDVLVRVLAGEDVGTLFVPPARRVLSSRKHWIAYGAQAGRQARRRRRRGARAARRRQEPAAGGHHRGRRRRSSSANGERS